jgi:hypothetical protein
MKKRSIISLALAVVLGLGVSWIDSRPTWDDAGISALMVLSAAAFCGLLSSQRPWLIALAVGIWIPLFGIISTGNYGGILALIPAFLGAYAAHFIRKLINSPA